MSKKLIAGLVGASLLAGAWTCQAANWVKNEVDVPNKNIEANYYDSKSVKAHHKIMNWTEKFVLTPFGSEAYTKHLKTFPTCAKAVEENGPAAYHQIDFEITKGKFRTVTKRNYTRDNKLLCTDKDMGKEFDTKWHEIVFRSPMYERYYLLVTKYKLGDI
ncbi:hypothetical protein [Geomesophilobacter sediminis]|uniref:Lipoprotein n=1 Tax=Geomesophilobacter sediminis TaxID=2798584 RepID=A0A8J7M2W2_9BACT|nr:hypothetical protein [Geomesophilobacter sediminis]MBJ6727293.1 hypothetical protein [Geomesophilobacter sediminis]